MCQLVLKSDPNRNCYLSIDWDRTKGEKGKTWSWQGGRYDLETNAGQWHSERFKDEVYETALILTSQTTKLEVLLLYGVPEDFFDQVNCGKTLDGENALRAANFESLRYRLYIPCV